MVETIYISNIFARYELNRCYFLWKVNYIVLALIKWVLYVTPGNVGMSKLHWISWWQQRKYWVIIQYVTGSDQQYWLHDTVSYGNSCSSLKSRVFLTICQITAKNRFPPHFDKDLCNLCVLYERNKWNAKNLRAQCTFITQVLVLLSVSFFSSSHTTWIEVARAGKWKNVTGCFGWKTKHILLNYVLYDFRPIRKLCRIDFLSAIKCVIQPYTWYTIWHGTRNIVLFIERSAIFIHSHINFIELRSIWYYCCCFLPPFDIYSVLHRFNLFYLKDFFILFNRIGSKNKEKKH